MSSTEAAYNAEGLQGRHFLTLADFSGRADVTARLRKDLKQWQNKGNRTARRQDVRHDLCQSSTRTRVSF